jgi:putative ABC transport system permease protein
VRALSRNKLRSALTALGITIGVAAVVCVVAIGHAGSDRAEAQLQSLGDNFVWVEAGSRNINGVRNGAHGTTSLTLDDCDAIRSEVPLIKACSPQADGNVAVAYGNQSWLTHYRGVSPEFVAIRRWPIIEGDGFTAEQVDQAAGVCVLGQTVRKQLFGAESPIGRDIRLQNLLCTVIGVLAPKGQTSFGQDQDDTLLLPYTTANARIRGRGYAWLDDILCSAVTPLAVNPAIDRISDLMRQRHGIRPGEDDDFNIRRPDELIKAQIEASRTLALLLICIASVSLLVGGIGVMNVMLVSVAQRTKEIGLRMAIGATPSSVQLQFLAEAVMLSLFGGAVGVALGVGTSLLLGRALEWPMSIPPEALAIAPGFSIAVGVFFGFWPAWKAARLDPIAALRHE